MICFRCLKLLITIMAFAMLLPVAALAGCPAGTIPGGANVPGQENAGFASCIEIEPPPVYEEEEEASGGDAGGDRSLPPPFDPGEFAALLKRKNGYAKKEEELRMKDPKYRELKQGVWKFSQSKPGDPRQFCSASFLQLNGGVLMLDWGGKQKGTYIAFYGGAIPAAKDSKPVKVSLVQSGETQTVQAFHAAFPWEKRLGMIIFAVPSTKALLASIEDRQDYAVKMSGEVVINGEWHSGAKAKKALGRCVSVRK